MKKFTLFYLLLTVMMFCTSFNLLAQYAVSGADDPDVNGLYNVVSTVNGKPSYFNGNYYLYNKNCNTKWAIGSSTSGCPEYSTLTNGDTPASQGWHEGGRRDYFYSSSIIVAKMNSIAYNKEVFVESPSDNGTFTDTIHILLNSVENPFTGTNNENFVATGKVAVSNLPAGLTAVVKRTSDSTLIATFTGTAINHSVADSVNNLTFTFQNTAFADRDASEIEFSSKNNLKIRFLEKFMVFGATSYPAVNDTFFLTGRLYKNRPVYSNGAYSIYYKGCTAKWALASNTGGCPRYSTAVDGNSVPYNAWYNGGQGHGSNDTVYISHFNSLSYSKTGFRESMSDDGSFNEIIKITYVAPANSNMFTGNNGDDFVAGGKVVVSNLPAGLTAHIIRTSNTSLNVTLTGNATYHSYSSSIHNLSFQFTNSAFSNGGASAVENCIKNDIEILFKVIEYEVFGATLTPEVNGTYIYSGINNGKPYFVNGDYKLYYKNCTAKWAIYNTTTSISCPLYSTRTNGDNPPFEGWSSGGRGGNGNDTIFVIPHNTIIYSSSLVSGSTSDGTINDTLAITYYLPGGNKFTGVNGDNFIAGGKILVSNLPVGLTALALRTSDTTLTIKFTGAAVHHRSSDQVNNLTFEFQNTAFTNGGASDVGNHLKNDLVVQFLQKYDVIGATSVPGVNGTYTFSGVFNGKPFFSKGEYRLGYRGCGSKWVIVDGDDDSNIDGGNCPEYYTRIDGDNPSVEGWRNNYDSNVIQVIPHNSIVYSRNSIVESALNNGIISDTLAVTYFFPAGGNAFTGTNGSDFIAGGKLRVSNLPAGLTALALRTSDTTLTIKFMGAATHHEITDCIDNLTFEFLNAAFSNADTSKVENPVRNDIRVAFQMKYEVFDAVNTTSMNGTYTTSGLFNGKPVFSFGEYRLGYRGCNSKWVIVGGDSDNNLNSNYCPRTRTEVDGDLPPTAGWFNEAVKVQPHNSLYYSKTIFNESSASVGSIDNTDTLIIRYFFPQGAAIFSGDNGDDFVAEGKITVSNLPGGLTAVAERTSDTTLTFVLTGTSISDDVFLTIAFSDEAFDGISASKVFCTIRSDIKINYHKEYYVASAGGDFTSIKQAINDIKVNDGDVLILAAETFTEYGITVNKELTFRGQGAGKTIVQANASPFTASNRIFYINFSNDQVKRATFENMTLQNGKSSDGGGCIYSRYTNLVVNNCEFKNNQTSYNGGAVTTYYGNVSIENSTFTGNKVTYTSTGTSYGGGALHLTSYNSSDAAFISNCTFSNNIARMQYGGALWSYIYTNISNSTFTNDTAFYGGAIYRNSRTVNMTNVIVANNGATTNGNDIYGSVNANYCLIEDVIGASITGANNVTGVDPELSALANNGGSTQTCALSATSPAKDSGTNLNAPLTDQRGVGINGVKDIGAYEYNTTPYIIVSDTTIKFGDILLNNSVEQSYTLSAVNLTSNLVVTAPAGYKVSGYSGTGGASTMTIVPVSGNISDTTIFVECLPTTSGVLNKTITNASTGANTVSISVKARGVNKPLGGNGIVTIAENVIKYFASRDFVFTDPDGDVLAGIQVVSKETNGDLEYKGVNVSNGVLCDGISNLTFKPFANQSGLAYATFTFKVKDNTGYYSESVYTMTINVNNAPTITNAIPDGDAQVGVAYNYVVPSNTFTDINSGDVLVYTATLSDNSTLPTWLNFSGTARTFSGTPVTSGNISIRVTAKDRAMASVSDEFVLRIAAGTGIDDDKLGDKVRVYPNPTSGAFSISIQNLKPVINILITDLIGKTVINKTVDDNKTVIDLSNYAKGIYLLRLSDGEVTITKKIIVQ